MKHVDAYPSSGDSISHEIFISVIAIIKGALLDGFSRCAKIKVAKIPLGLNSSYSL